MHNYNQCREILQQKIYHTEYLNNVKFQTANGSISPICCLSFINSFLRHQHLWQDIQFLKWYFIKHLELKATAAVR